MSGVNQPHPDPLAARFANPGHRYPEMTRAGFGHLWVGPGFNDFAPELITAVQAHLALHNLPAQRGHACDYIRNRIRTQDWGALEQRWEERKRKQGPSEGMKKAIRKRYARPRDTE
jgi:hypothetical protein